MKITLAGLMLVLSASLYSQNIAQNSISPKNPSWAINWKPAKAFIENKGQFNGRNHFPGSEILYAIDQSATQIYFTANGFTYRFDKHIKNPKRKKGDVSKAKYITESDLVQLEWRGSNPDVKIIASDKSEGYHSYAFYEGGEIKNINEINGYSKLIYKNLYPNIDVEYIFHEKGGIKYSVILHPGADVSKVKMKYPDDKKIRVDNAGNLHIETTFGDIIEHSPFTFYSDNHKPILSSFSLKNNIVAFSLANDKGKVGTTSIIIDPWVQTPTLANSNGVWECERDGAGNVYIIGGDMPMKLQKYTSAGVFQWTYSTPWDTANNWLGTLATDLAGNSYVTSGSTAAMQKVGANGAMIWSQTGGSMDEYWTISFNCDQTKLIVGGTRIVGLPSPTGDGVIFDINTSNGNVNSLKTVGKSRTMTVFGFPVTDIEEVRSMSSSRNAKYYFITLDTIGAIDQNFSACPTGNLFNINHTYAFGYKSENYRPNNGNSGIKAVRANGNFVYTQNGTTLHKRSLATGVILASATIPGGLNTSSQGVNQPGNNGIDIDSCGNVYVGSGNAVVKYDANLNLITSASTSFAVFDVAVSYNGDVVVCGATGNSSSTSRTGYVQSFNMSSCDPMVLFCCDATVCPAGPLCITGSPVTLTPVVTGGTWSGQGVNGSGVFNPATAGLGTHTIAYTLGCGSDSITITVNSCTALTACQESNGNVTATSGSAPFTWYKQTTTQNCSSCFFSICDNPPGCTQNVISWTSFGTGTTVTPPSFPILLIDANGDSLQISSLSSLPNCSNCTAAATATNATCGSNNGTATANPAGTSPYSYSWSNGQTAQTATGLAPGSYTVTVTDNNGCSSVATAIVSSNPNLPIATISGTSSICSGGSTVLTASGGDSYTWSTGATTDTISITPSSTTTYIVTATNICGSDTAQITVNVGGGNFSVSTNNTLATCGQCNASATASPSGGTNPYSYSWSTGQTTQTISGLCAGNYVVTVSEGGGCSTVGSVSVGSASNITATATSSVTSCTGNSGTATANPSGGTSPYTYLWNNGQGTQTATGLAAGNYLVTVTDSSGCTALTSTTVGTTTGPTSSTAANNASCNGANDGSAIVNPSGGTSPYTYLWSNGLTSQNISGLTPGNYYVTVTDANNCTVTDTATVTDGGIPTATAGSIATSCNGGGDGSATVIINSGVSPYTYSWDNGDTIQTISGLSPGTYSVTVTDANGCFATATTTVSQPTAIAALTTSVNASCGMSDGSATVNPSGGTSPYTYLWAANANNQTTVTATGLAAASYDVTITDDNGCTQTATATVSNAGAPTVTANPTSPLCFGDSNGSATATPAGGNSPYTYQWSNGDITSNADSLSAGTYTVTVTDNATCSAVSAVTITDPPLFTAQIISNDTIVCSGGTANLLAFGGAPYTWSTGQSTASIAVTNITSDSTIFVTATNNNGCTGTDSIEITVISASINITSPDTQLCPGENTSLIVNGGNTYLWSTTETNDTIIVSPPTDSSYFVSGTYGPGCVAADTISVSVGQGVDAVVSNDTTIGYGASIQIVSSGGDYYLWSTGEITPSITVSPEVNTTFTVTVVDAYGCRDIDTIIITVECRHAISIPTIFSPNNDGINDFIKVHGYGIAEMSFVIYDRWGEKIFEATEREQQWDGTRNGKALNSAVFVYILDVTYCDGVEYNEKGNITLIK